MNVNGKSTRTIRLVETEGRPSIEIIDQRKLPHRLEYVRLHTVEDVARAIKEMYVRGAPLIGSTAALGMHLAVCEAINFATQFGHPNQTEALFQSKFKEYAGMLRVTRPTAINLMWAIDQQMLVTKCFPTFPERIQHTREKALEIVESDVNQCRMIGVHGLDIIKKIAAKKPGETINILTHCNAGWLATVDWGTATSPMYHAFKEGIDIHIWVDETRPRNQGAKLTAWELGQHGIKHTVICDNTGGHLMQHGMVDMVLVGTDRTARNGDVANKIGTYLKALAAKDNNIPFYVALPSTTFDMSITDGVAEIPVEQRDATEVTYVDGAINGELAEVLITPPDSPACNYAFDVTPARLVSGLITEKGVCSANEASITSMFPELAH
ncbi:MAG: S-methyl-5-thioribose-1-phosphate isomerase [Gammaproteobacteria bacterium]|nr:S-methyl-5-thioribose-1-phosphate isomerase [Gammaproteobacteria bacterium]